jgi:hypothetical protein
MKKIKISGKPFDDDSQLGGNQRELNQLRRWEKHFRDDAKSDKYALFRNHLRRLGLPEKPKLMLEGTVNVMQAIWVFANLDDQLIGGFLANQQYDPSDAPDPSYIFTFGLYERAFPRVIVNSIQKHPLDLADLFGYPWADYKLAGFDYIWISHPDWSPLTDDEFRYLETMITDDIYYDYGKDEVNIYFDDITDPCCLCVNVQEIFEEDDETNKTNGNLKMGGFLDESRRKIQN